MEVNGKCFKGQRMAREPVYRVLGEEFEIREKRILPNGIQIKIYDSDPYHYARVVGGDGEIIKETGVFPMSQDEKVITELLKKYS